MCSTVGLGAFAVFHINHIIFLMLAAVETTRLAKMVERGLCSTVGLGTFAAHHINHINPFVLAAVEATGRAR